MFKRYEKETKMTRFSMHRLVEMYQEDEISDSFYEEMRKNEEEAEKYVVKLDEDYACEREEVDSCSDL